MKISRFPAAAAWAMALTLAMPALGAEKGVSLRPKLTKGATARFTVTTEGSNTTWSDAFLQGETTQTVNREIRVAHKVIESSESGAVVELTYERIKLSVQVPAMNMIHAFDSQTPPSRDADSPIAEVMRPLVGATITLTIGSDGQIKNVKSPRSLAKPGPLGALPNELLDPEFIRKTYANLYSVNCAKASAAPGDTWTFAESRPLFAGAKLNIGYSYKMASATGQEASITSTGKAEVAMPAPNAAGNNNGSNKPSTELKASSFEGSVTWDSKAGMARSVTRSERLKFTMDPNQGSIISNETTLRETITRSE